MGDVDWEAGCQQTHGSRHGLVDVIDRDEPGNVTAKP
jgi:hypothetical protein